MFLTQSVVFQHHNFEILEDFDPPEKDWTRKNLKKAPKPRCYYIHRFLWCFTFGCFPKSNKTNFYFFPKNPHEKHEKKTPKLFFQKRPNQEKRFVFNQACDNLRPSTSTTSCSIGSTGSAKHRWLVGLGDEILHSYSGDYDKPL